MSFNDAWFDELRSLSLEKLGLVQPASFRPTVAELYAGGAISQAFLNSTLELVKGLQATHFKLAPLFRAYEHHICNFPAGKAFRKQWNIGFTAGDDVTGDFVRIGIGFSLNKEMSQQGIDEYADFLAQVAQRKDAFDETFSLLGYYAEPFGVLKEMSLSRLILKDTPNLADDWRFFGKVLQRSNPDDAIHLISSEALAQEAVRVFTIIEKNGFC